MPGDDAWALFGDDDDDDDVKDTSTTGASMFIDAAKDAPPPPFLRIDPRAARNAFFTSARFAWERCLQGGDKMDAEVLQ